ncbi:MAG: rhomboid family intramembrane serine protease [Tannerellaceae bacterium]|nr:rhomboid family intramembrane serine protease [Tannerellaceae bacterium]MCD8042052.1 rhomboid family intramembrane serine protease [Tannerellaceae bacterium]MCD8178935.1 rhomboid family intramembrane serine protease [Tannerellaceae bacterium]
MITILIVATTAVVSFICFSRPDIFYKLSFNPYRIIKYNEWSRFITHGFVHADMMHLFVNMFTFWSFGSFMESLFNQLGFGVGGYLGLYFGGMVAASIHDLFKYKNFESYNSIGASGAVSAVLFSSILFNPWGKILLFAIIPVPGIIFGFVYLFYCQYMARQSRDNINHNAHFFGAVYGLLYPLLLDWTLIYHFLYSLTHP